MNKYYLLELFEPTLLYSLALSILGSAAAVHYMHFSWTFVLLAIIGSSLAQMSVNVISDYFDYKSGLDKELARNKSDQLSGGSSFLAEGLIEPRWTLVMGTIVFLLGAAIGIYLLLNRPEILPILIIAILSIFLYAKYVKKIPYFSEPVCTFNYTLITIGSFLVASGIALPASLLFAFIPAGIMLGGDALFVNEVPDKDIDRKYGVRHSAVMLKTSKRIGLYYLSWQSAAYVILVLGIALGRVPLLALASLVTVPSTLYVFNGLYKGRSKKYGNYLSMHTLFSVMFGLILVVSYVI